MTRNLSGRKAVIIIGSPRKKGSTGELAKEAERGLTSIGIPAETIWLNDLSIRDCQACHGCKRGDNSDCIITDDMTGVYQLIRESAGIIVASPVFFGNVSGITRLWLDRLVPFIGTDLRPKLPGGKTASFIFTQNLPDTSAFRPGLVSFMDSVAMTGMTCRGYLVAGDCEAGLKPPVAERSDIMDRAFGIGRDLFD